MGIFLGKYFWWIDGLLGVLIAILILYAAYDVLKEGINPLLGERPDEQLVSRIREVTERLAPSAVDVHHIHCHRYGRHRELTFHICLDETMSLIESHSIADMIESAIREELDIEATIHVDPLNPEKCGPD